MKTVIIDYDGGNVCSVLNAFSAISDSTKIIVSNDLAEIKSATHLVLPGVGAFSDCIKGLKSVDGLISELNQQVLVQQKPFLGICVGMQVMAGHHQEATLLDVALQVERNRPWPLVAP